MLVYVNLLFLPLLSSHIIYDIGYNIDAMENCGSWFKLKPLIFRGKF